MHLRRRHKRSRQDAIRGVAQPGRVLRSGRRSRRFESSHPDQVFLFYSRASRQTAADSVPLAGRHRPQASGLPACDSCCELSGAEARIICRSGCGGGPARAVRITECPMAKILLLALIVAAVLMLMRGFRRRPPPPSSETAGDQPMVRCAHCGLHLPRDESVACGARYFCSEQHRIDAKGGR